MNISDKRAKAGNCIFRCHGGQPDSYPYCRYYVRPAPYGGGLNPNPIMIHRPGGSSHHTPAYIPGKTLHSVPVNGQPSVRLSSQKKNSLSACVRRTDRKAVFFCRGSGMFHRTPLAVFSLELVAYLERAAYAFPRPRIAGGAKQEGDRNLF